MKKIPDHAKKVFGGVIFDVYQWEQEMFDGSTATFERLWRPATIQVLATRGDRIVLNKEEQPGSPLFYGMPGGREEPEEEPLVCAKRELLEEAGMESDDWELYSTHQPVSKLDWNVHTFIARNCKQVTEQNLDPGERIETVEVTFEKFLELIQGDEFWGREIAHDILRLMLKGEIDMFKKRLFPNS